MNEEDTCHHGKLTMEYNGEEERVEDSTRRNNIADNGARGITFLIARRKAEWRERGREEEVAGEPLLLVFLDRHNAEARREAPHPSEGRQR